MKLLNIEKLLKKREYYQKNKGFIPVLTKESYEQAFEIEYVHNSTAIEGNTLTLIETKLILEDRISIGGKNLWGIYEQVNHQKAFHYIKDCVNKKMPLNKKIIKDIYTMLIKNIIDNNAHQVTDTKLIFSKTNEIRKQIKNFYISSAPNDKNFNSIEFVARTHAEIIKAHPFWYSNRYMAGLLMNYQLMSNEFFPISIAKENRFEYFNTLETYTVKNDLTPFADMIAALEEQQLDKYIGMIKIDL